MATERPQWGRLRTGGLNRTRIVNANEGISLSLPQEDSPKSSHQHDLASFAIPIIRQLMNLNELPSRYETERLLLRPFVRSDHADYAAYHSRSDVYRYLLSAPPTERELEEKFEKVLNAKFDADGDVYRLAVIARNGHFLMGEVMIQLVSRLAGQGEIGYICNPEYGGQGFATEAMNEMLRIGFEILHFHRLFARLDAANEGSVRLLDRLGLRREAHLVQNHLFNEMWIDECIYALLQAEWTAQTRWLNPPMGR